MNQLHKINCIMLVDDDEPTNFIHNLVITRADCARHVRIFDYAETAMDYLHHCLDSNEKDTYYQKPDLIFLDINMPRTNAWEFIDEYRKQPGYQTKDTVVIMLTTSLNPDDQLKAEGMPEIAGYYNKPLTEQVLQQIIAKHFDTKSG
jgi:CheY-like chemotaxis protein